MLKNMYGPTILRKLQLSEKFPRKVLYSIKTSLEVELLAPRTIVDILVLKLYVGYQRVDLKLEKIIKISKKNTRILYQYS